MSSKRLTYKCPILFLWPDGTNILEPHSTIPFPITFTMVTLVGDTLLLGEMGSMLKRLKAEYIIPFHGDHVIF